MVNLINGDCLEEMDKLIEQGVKVQGALFSPPYNIMRPNQKDRGYDKYNDGMNNKSYTNWIKNIFIKLNEIMDKNSCILLNLSYGSENTTCAFLTIAKIIEETNYTIADVITWKKNTAFPNDMSPNKLTRITEFIFVLCRKKEFKTFKSNKKVKSYRKTGQANYENVYNFVEAKNNDGSNSLNKCTYSTDLCNKMLNLYFKKGDTIIDIFNGTGTTGVSAINLGMSYIGIELSKKQYEYSKERIKQAENDKKYNLF